jgi:hypothetical protein
LITSSLLVGVAEVQETLQLFGVGAGVALVDLELAQD